MIRFTVRLRLTLICTALVVVCGAVLLGLTYVLVARLPLVAEYQSPVHPGGQPLPDLPPLTPTAQQQRDAHLRQLIGQSAIALAITAIVACGLSWLLAGRILNTLRTITAAVQRISASSLDQRLALGGPRDELTELGDTFDDLLARLERSFAAQRRFVAHASHELRTPLTVLRTHLEAAASHPDPTPDSWRLANERALAASGHLERILDSLLTLARSEGGLDRWQRVDLADVAGDVVEARRADLEARQLRLVADLEPAPVLGDERLLERLVTNLVDNACRYNLPGGCLTVVTLAGADGPTLSVTNTGRVIPADAVARIIQPFQRLDSSPGAGAGLGLSIVDAIATAHSARLEVTANDGGGLTVTVRFPPGSAS